MGMQSPETTTIRTDQFLDIEDQALLRALGIDASHNKGLNFFTQNSPEGHNILVYPKNRPNPFDLQYKSSSVPPGILYLEPLVLPTEIITQHIGSTEMPSELIGISNGILPYWHIAKCLNDPRNALRKQSVCGFFDDMSPVVPLKAIKKGQLDWHPLQFVNPMQKDAQLFQNEGAAKAYGDVISVGLPDDPAEICNAIQQFGPDLTWYIDLDTRSDSAGGGWKLNTQSSLPGALFYWMHQRIWPGSRAMIYSYLGDDLGQKRKRLQQEIELFKADVSRMLPSEFQRLPEVPEGTYVTQPFIRRQEDEQEIVDFLGNLTRYASSRYLQ